MRIAFPQLNIQCGIWEDRVDRVAYLLKAGANSISKFKGLKLFGTPLAAEIERQAMMAGRTFRGTLTELPAVDWARCVDELHFEPELSDSGLKERIKMALDNYLRTMRKNMVAAPVVINP